MGTHMTHFIPHCHFDMTRSSPADGFTYFHCHRDPSISPQDLFSNPLTSEPFEDVIPIKLKTLSRECGCHLTSKQKEPTLNSTHCPVHKTCTLHWEFDFLTFLGFQTLDSNDLQKPYEAHVQLWCLALGLKHNLLLILYHILVVLNLFI